MDEAKAIRQKADEEGAATEAEHAQDVSLASSEEATPESTQRMGTVATAPAAAVEAPKPAVAVKPPSTGVTAQGGKADATPSSVADAVVVKTDNTPATAVKATTPPAAVKALTPAAAVKPPTPVKAVAPTTPSAVAETTPASDMVVLHGLTNDVSLNGLKVRKLAEEDGHAVVDLDGEPVKVSPANIKAPLRVADTSTTTMMAPAVPTVDVLNTPGPSSSKQMVRLQGLVGDTTLNGRVVEKLGVETTENVEMIRVDLDGEMVLVAGSNVVPLHAGQDLSWAW